MNVERELHIMEAFSADRARRQKLPLAAVVALLALCIAPIGAMIVISSVLGRDCTVLSASEGEALPNLLWRIEVQRCGSGSEVTNVLVAPRGKSFALAASARGTPKPARVERTEDGATWIVFDRASSDGVTERILPLKATGRPAQPLVLLDGTPVR